MAKLNEVVGKVRAAYDGYEFHLVYHLLSEFCTVTLSARYFDIIKDRLYTFAPRNKARRSAQTALYHIADALARMMAPILVFTGDEIWENLPPDSARPDSVHLAVLPEGKSRADESLISVWQGLFLYRESILLRLEQARNQKMIGSSLDAHVVIQAGGATYQLLSRYEQELRYILIVSQVTLIKRDSPVVSDVGPLIVEIKRADGEKCERCWNYSTHLGESSRYPSICERCVTALAEIEQESER